MTTPERQDDTRQDPPTEGIINTGGCAFPDVVKGRNGPEYLPGMTLRQWYAGQFISGNAAQYCNEEDCHHGAALAFRWADAMIAAQ